MAVGVLAAATPAQAIVGGRQASQYSFLAYFSVQGKACAGVLIKSDWLATARHCMPDSPDHFENFPARVGSNNRNSGGTTRQVNFIQLMTGLDLVLLHLASPVNQAPVAIAAAPPLINNVVRIIGWGQTCPTFGCGEAPAVARERDTVVSSENRCSGGFIDGTFEMCSTTGGCFGDSGGPVLRSPNADDNWVLHGIISRGSNQEDCNQANTISVDMAVQRDLIASLIGGLP